MYPTSEVQISRRHLSGVVSAMLEPTVVLGGWAVFLLVNESYREVTGREYVGSRDIDLGFNPGSGSLAFEHAYRRLTRELGFRPLSFRLFKEIDIETGRALGEDEAKRTPQHRIFQMCVDMVVDAIPPGFRKKHGFTPIDEPLLSPVFESPSNRVEARAFGKTIWLPSPDLLLAMKVRSCPDRDKEHKRVKDIADIAALILFSGATGQRATRAERQKLLRIAQSGEIKQVAEVLGLEPQTIENALGTLR